MRALLLLVVCSGGFLAAQEPQYGVGSWDADSFGNQRAVVRVTQASAAVRVTIPWRRRDPFPDQRDVVVRAAASGQVVRLARGSITREAGTIAFDPAAGPGDYHVYYLRYTGSVHANYPRVTYPPVAPADTVWLRGLGLEEGGAGWRTIPEAELVMLQGADGWNRIDPMDLIAGRAETAGLLVRHPGAAMLLFPEDREHPIRMTQDLPHRWTLAGANTPIGATAVAGAYLSWQVGVYAAEPLESLTVSYSALRGDAAGVFPPTAFTCFNPGGVDWEGRAFHTRVDVAAGRVQPLWFGVAVPASTRPGS